MEAISQTRRGPQWMPGRPTTSAGAAMPPAWGVSRSSWTRPCTRQWPRLRRSSWRFPTSHGSPKYHHPWTFHCEPSSYWGSPIYGNLEIPSFFRTVPWGTNRKMWKDPWGNPFGKRSTFDGGFSTVTLVYGRLPFFRSRRSILGMDQIILAYLYAMNIQHQLFCWGTEWYGRWFWVNKFSQIWQNGCSKMEPEKGGYRKLGTEREIYIYICTRPCHPPPPPHPHGMGPIYWPHMRSSPSPPCGVVGVWHCPPPPPVVWWGCGMVCWVCMVCMVGLVWHVWKVWYVWYVW